MRTVRIGSGAGFADDRIEPAVELVDRGELDYLVFECLAERTIALAQLDRLRDPDGGYNEWLEDRMEAVLPLAVEHGTRIVTNMGAANPIAAARLVAAIAERLGMTGLRIAAVTGDDVLSQVHGGDLPLLERAGTIRDLPSEVVSANAYLGIDGLLDALATGADVIIGGRFADPSLFLAPLVHEFGWRHDDWPLLGAGTAVGHLLECAAQVSGGYFADPPRTAVPDLARLGFPIAEVGEDGSITITKTPGSGGCVTTATVTQQLLYEVHDPAAYVTPDVVADFSRARLTVVGEDRVAVTDIGGRRRPDTLKVSVGYVDSYIGSGEISYAGPGAVTRGRLALDVVQERLSSIGVPMSESRFELIGVDAVHRGAGEPPQTDPVEVRVRVIGRTAEARQARRIGHEVVSLWLNGPAGGGGATRSTAVDVAIVSVLLPRDAVPVATTLFGGAA